MASGSSVVGAYQINTGLNRWQGTGWGAGSWGLERGAAVQYLLLASYVCGPRWCEDLMLMPSWRTMGRSSCTGTRGVNITSLAGASDAPTVALQIMVSDTDQHVIAGVNLIGSSNIDPLFMGSLIRKMPIDSTAANTAGGVRINSGSEIIGAVQTRQEILIWTDVSLLDEIYWGSVC